MSLDQNSGRWVQLQGHGHILPSAGQTAHNRGSVIPPKLLLLPPPPHHHHHSPFLLFPFEKGRCLRDVKALDTRSWRWVIYLGNGPGNMERTRQEAITSPDFSCHDPTAQQTPEQQTGCLRGWQGGAPPEAPSEGQVGSSGRHQLYLLLFCVSCL